MAIELQRSTSIGNGITLSPTDGARPAGNAAQVKAGAEMAIGAKSLIFANFDAEFSGVNQLYAGKGGVPYAL